MTKHKKVAPDPLLDALTDELIAMTDEQVLAGEDPALVLAQGRDLLAKAGADAGKRRLAAAKTAVEARRRSPPPRRRPRRLQHICYEHQNVEDFAKSIEAKLKEKNHG